MSLITLYGAPFSLYTGRARSYLIKAGLAYRETAPNTEHYQQTVLPAAGDRRGIPTLETAEGEVVRDGAAIIEHYEAKSGYGFSPVGPKQRIISRLFDVIGAEGLLRPAMHYRWNFPEQNLDFLQFHFEGLMPQDGNQQQTAEASMNAMRNATQMFGVVPDTFALVEELYLDLIAKLNTHFAEQPYLLGGKPCLGDFGLLAPLYAHLGRDPAPLNIMQTQAVRLFRWVERMNRPEADAGEYGEQNDEYLAGDEIPSTLIDVLKQVAVDFVPETEAAALCINQWLAEQDALAPQTTAERAVGLCQFEVNGQTINAIAQPYRFYLLQALQDDYAALDAVAQQQVAELLDACNMGAVLCAKLDRRMGRANNLEVWL